MQPTVGKQTFCNTRVLPHSLTNTLAPSHFNDNSCSTRDFTPKRDIVSLPDKMALDASLKTNAGYKDVNDGLSRNFYPTLGCANKDRHES